MREYVLFVILIFIPIGLALNYFLRREGLPQKDTNIILALALLIIFTFPICMARWGIFTSMLIYLLVISVLVAYLMRLGESPYLEKAFTSLRTLRFRRGLVEEPDISGLTYEEATNLLLGSLENTAREMLGPVPNIESDLKKEYWTAEEVLPLMHEKIVSINQAGENGMPGLTTDIDAVDTEPEEEIAESIEEETSTTVLLEPEPDRVGVEEPRESEMDRIMETAVNEESIVVSIEEPEVTEVQGSGEDLADAEAAIGKDTDEAMEDTNSEVTNETIETIGEAWDTIIRGAENLEAEVSEATVLNSEEVEPSEVMEAAAGEVGQLSGEVQPMAENLERDEPEADRIEFFDHYEADSEESETAEVAEEILDGFDTVIAEIQLTSELSGEPVETCPVQEEVEEENEAVFTEAQPAEFIEAATESYEALISEDQPQDIGEPSEFQSGSEDSTGPAPEEEQEIEASGVVLLEAGLEDEIVAEAVETEEPAMLVDGSEEAEDEIPAEVVADDADRLQAEASAETVESDEEIESGELSERVDVDEASRLTETEDEYVPEEIASLPNAEDEADLEASWEDNESEEETELLADHEMTLEPLTTGGDILHPVADEQVVPVLQEGDIPEQISEVQEIENHTRMLTGEPDEEAASEHTVEQSKIAVGSAEVNRWIDEGFRFKARADLPAAIYAFIQAWNCVEDNELKYLITLELVELYKGCGYYNYAEQVLGNYLELGGHKSDIIYEINRQLDAVRFLATELTRLGMSGAPWAQVPRWIRMELENALNQ